MDCYTKTIGYKDITIGNKTVNIINMV